MRKLDEILSDALAADPDDGLAPAQCYDCERPMRVQPEHVQRKPLCAYCAAARREARLRDQQRRIQLRQLRLCAEDIDAIRTGEYEETRAVEHVEAWLATEAPMLVLCGGVGVGKSFAAGLALDRLGGTAIRSSELSQRIDPWQDESERYEWADVATGRLLILDDLGTELDSPRWRATFDRFVDARKAHGRTVITANLRKRAIRDNYGDRVADRLNDCARAVEIAGESMRRKGDL